MEQPAEIRCPTCGAPVPVGPDLPESFPFCDRRCRLRDLGAWLDGRRAIPGREGAPVGDRDGLPP